MQGYVFLKTAVINLHITHSKKKPCILSMLKFKEVLYSRWYRQFNTRFFSLPLTPCYFDLYSAINHRLFQGLSALDAVFKMLNFGCCLQLHCPCKELSCCFCVQSLLCKRGAYRCVCRSPHFSVRLIRRGVWCLYITSAADDVVEQ